MRIRQRAAQGFTLVEILIVVVILGILAAVVIPQFTSASESARASSLISQLQTIRSQIELYEVQHSDTSPFADAMNWDKMTQTTDATGATSGTKFGPYLQQPPSNPFTNSSTIVDGASNATTSTGWVLDSTGKMKAVVSLTDTEAQDLGLIGSGETLSGSSNFVQVGQG
jgi:general secretion pathway protein G